MQCAFGVQNFRVPRLVFVNKRVALGNGINTKCRNQKIDSLINGNSVTTSTNIMISEVLNAQNNK